MHAIPRNSMATNCGISQKYVCQNIIDVQLLNFFLKKKKPDSIKGICRPMMTASQNWKLGMVEEEGQVEAEEVVLRIQGIICNRDLPPIQRPFKM